MGAWLQKQWYKIGIWHGLLIPVSWLFFVLVAIRRYAYHVGLLKSYALPVPVVVVGNIAVGGTGKTPVVIWLTEQLLALGWRPAIISRGYGGECALPRQVNTDSDPAHVGDEPLLMAQRLACPVWVGVDRVATAKALLRAYPECNILLSDDGLQHYRLRRNVEIAVTDAIRAHGNGWVLPAGPLREPVSRLYAVDIMVNNGGAANSSNVVGMHMQAHRFRNLADPAKTAAPEDFHDQELHAIAGIGHPDRFFNQLESMGMQIVKHAYPDHHAYRPQDLQFADNATILMTEKDAVKCRRFAHPDWWYLPVNAVMDGDLLGMVLEKINQNSL